MKKFIFALVGAIFLFVLVIVAGFLDSVDTWVCREGNWEKYGDPQTPPPEEDECGEDGLVTPSNPKE